MRQPIQLKHLAADAGDDDDGDDDGDDDVDADDDEHRAMRQLVQL